MYQQIGKYKVLKLLGKGGFGSVYLAFDPLLKRKVAIKICSSTSEKFKQRFLREAKIAGKLDHPNITIIHDFGYHGDTPYLVQEYLEGEDLDKLLKKHTFSLEETVNILLQVAQALKYAHDQGIIHRDVKPSNIRILPDKSAKIMDFGIASLVDATVRLTMTGMMLGTAGYLAPEQIRSSKVDQRADIFSFGVVTYEMVTNQKPFTGNSIPQLLTSILTKEPTPPHKVNPNCPYELSSLIMRMLEKNPEKRLQSFEPIIHHLKVLKSTKKSLKPPVTAKQETSTSSNYKSNAQVIKTLDTKIRNIYTHINKKIILSFIAITIGLALIVLYILLINM